MSSIDKIDDTANEESSFLILAGSFYPEVSGGAHTQWHFCQNLINRGHNVTVLTPRDNGEPKREIVKGIDIIRPIPSRLPNVPGKSYFAILTQAIFSVIATIYALRIIRQKEIDRIYSQSVFLHWVAKIVSSVYDLPLVTFIGYTPSLRSSLTFSPKRLLERLNFQFFLGDVVFCREPETKKRIENLSNAHVEVIHGILDNQKIRDINEKDIGDVRTQYCTKDNERLLIFVGRLVEVKNPLALADIMAALPNNYLLVVVGDGEMHPDLQRRMRNLHIEDRVNLIGQISHESTLAHIGAADGLVLTSKAEAYPTVVFEALALGTPVFAPPVGILRDLDHSKLHLTAVDEMADLIRSSECKSESINSRILRRYSIDRYTADIIGAFEKLEKRV
jgi:glycosyltransferase involved in cell wall biosynthesis